MKLMLAVVLFISVSIGLAEVDDDTLPHWQNLECEVSRQTGSREWKPFLRKVTSICSLRRPDPGWTLRRSVSCTGLAGGHQESGGG